MTLDKLLLPLQIAIINALKNLYAGGRKWGEGKEEGTFAELNAKKEKTYKYSCKSFFFFFFYIKTFMNLAKNQVKTSVDFQSANKGAILKNSTVST